MAFFNAGGGHNPQWGRDTGPPPPSNSRRMAGNAFSYPQQHGMVYGTVGARPYPQFNQAFWGNGAFAPLNHGAAMTQHAYPPGTAQPVRFADTGRVPTVGPVIDSSLPAANMTNSTGGVGCEPGYNYFFPSEHVKIRIFRTGDNPPWLLPAGSAVPFHSCHVPTNTTIADLLKGFGACNPDPSKNRVTEVHEGGNGRWYKGMSFKGDNFDEINKEVKEVGWDKTRTGLPGGKPVVCLYVTKG